MPDDLYERDILIWSEQQADLLHRLARGERVDDTVDWTNLVDEVLDVGGSELHGCESLLGQAMLNLMKMAVWPDGPVRHWRVETRAFLNGARRRFTPSMRQRIDLGGLYREACEQVADLQEEHARVAMPATCPFTLDELLAEPADFLALVGRLGAG